MTELDHPLPPFRPALPEEPQEDAPLPPFVLVAKDAESSNETLFFDDKPEKRLAVTPNFSVPLPGAVGIPSRCKRLVPSLAIFVLLGLGAIGVGLSTEYLQLPLSSAQFQRFLLENSCVVSDEQNGRVYAYRCPRLEGGGYLTVEQLRARAANR